MILLLSFTAIVFIALALVWWAQPGRLRKRGRGTVHYPDKESEK